MVDISNIVVLESFGKLRRGLNLAFTGSMKRIGLGYKQALFLRYLAKHPNASQAELSRATLTDPAAVNRALDSLIQKGWITRSDDPNDRRRWVVGLTPEGRKVAKKVDAAYSEIAERVFSVIPKVDRKIFHSLLEQILERGLPDEVRKELV